jgi:hypothetical protein
LRRYRNDESLDEGEIRKDSEVFIARLSRRRLSEAIFAKQKNTRASLPDGSRINRWSSFIWR